MERLDHLERAIWSGLAAPRKCKYPVRVAYRRACRVWEARVENIGAAQLPAAEESIIDIVPISAEPPSPAERQIVYAGHGYVVAGVHSGRTPFGLEVIGVLLIVLAAVDIAYAVEADVIGQRFGVSVVGRQFKSPPQVLPENCLQSIVVAGRFGPGDFDTPLWPTILA